MDKIKVVIRYENELKSITVDDNSMDIHAIKNLSMEDWFAASKNRSGWKGLKAQIFDMIEDDEAELVFQFIGPEKVKKDFVDLLKKYNLGNHADGIFDKEHIQQNVDNAEKYERLGEFDKAFQLYKENADKGDAEAQFYVAEYYYKFYNEEIVLSGEDKSNAFKKAAKYYEKAALQDHAKAQYTYYKLYHELKEEKELEDYLNEGLKEEKREHFLDNLISVFDQDRALIYLKRAAEHGNADAQYELGDCYNYGEGTEKDYNKAFKWYLKAAKQDHCLAQYAMGECYTNRYGTSKNLTEALAWYMKAAEQGYEKAQYTVGRCYENAYGTKKNPVKAFEWYLKAANQGNKYGQRAVGYCYDYGKGTTKNPEEAYKWYLKAAENGNSQAMCDVGICFDYSIGVKKDYSEAMKWYIKAVENGNDAAVFYLGKCFEFGKGVEKDYSMAINFYKMAADAESPDRDACYRIAEVYCEYFKTPQKKGKKGAAAIALAAAAVLVPVTNFITIPAAAVAYAFADGIIKDKTLLKSENGQEMIKYYKKAAELGHEEAKKKYEKYKKYLKQG